MLTYRDMGRLAHSAVRWLISFRQATDAGRRHAPEPGSVPRADIERHVVAGSVICRGGCSAARREVWPPQG